MICTALWCITRIEETDRTALSNSNYSYEYLVMLIITLWLLLLIYKIRAAELLMMNSMKGMFS